MNQVSLNRNNQFSLMNPEPMAEATLSSLTPEATKPRPDNLIYYDVEDQERRATPVSAKAIVDLKAYFDILGLLVNSISIQNNERLINFKHLYLSDPRVRVTSDNLLYLHNIDPGHVSVESICEMVFFSGNGQNPEPPLLKTLNNLV